MDRESRRVACGTSGDAAHVEYSIYSVLLHTLVGMRAFGRVHDIATVVAWPAVDGSAADLPRRSRCMRSYGRVHLAVHRVRMVKQR
eukprot:1004754-Pleurochrysis_carterae.AAC.1